MYSICLGFGGWQNEGVVCMSGGVHECEHVAACMCVFSFLKRKLLELTTNAGVAPEIE